ncbi:MAG TPA: DsbA family protein [Longimicrobiales bacterium]
MVDRSITLFADYVCPFSYMTVLGLDVLAAELAADVQRRAFELSPAPMPTAAAAIAQQWQAVQELAGQAGLRFARPDVVPRTRKAHEAFKYAATIGRHLALERAIFDAYFLRGEDIGRIDVLVRIGAEIGMDATALKIALDLDVHTADVAQDRAIAEDLDIMGTPALLAGGEVHVGYLSKKQLREWLGE